MIPANVELVRRHPEYLSVREYRPGLAYILRLSLWRRLKKGNLGGAARDVGQMAKAFGAGEAARLLFEACLPRRSVVIAENRIEVAATYVSTLAALSGCRRLRYPPLLPLRTLYEASSPFFAACNRDDWK